jgi:TolB-like protein/Flp pilus assembly protein TadD
MTGNPDDDAPPQALPARGGIAEFIEELQRRRVIRVALVYLVAAWLIIQVAQATFPALLLPDWTVTLVVVLSVLGFPVALILAWAYRIEAEHADTTATSVHYVVDKHRKLDFIVIAALSAVVVILAYELYVRQSTPQPVASSETQQLPTRPVASEDGSRPSIGVLPFLNLSDDKQNEYFADGLAEEILNLLVRIKEVDVAARTSSFYFKGKDVDIKTVAQLLGVTNILEGSVRRQDDRIRVTAQLIEAESGFHLWSNTYDRDFEDVFEIQDDIAREVTAALELVMSNDSNNALGRIPTDSMEAYNYYLQGRDYLRGEHTVTRLESARALFQDAIEIDSDFAEAYAGLCNTFLALYGRSRSTEYFELAERACHRGVTLDAAAGDVHSALGSLYRESGQYDEAEIEFERAMLLNSMDIQSYIGLAETFAHQDRLDEAEDLYRRVIELQPGIWRGYIELGRFFFYTGRLQESIDAFSRAVRLAPDVATGYLNLGSSYYLLGDFDNAASAWRKSLELEPSTSAYMNLGSSYFFLGRFEDAAEMYRQASDLAPDDFEVWGALGDAHRYAANGELSAQAYGRAIELGEELLTINQSAAMIAAPLAQYHAHMDNADRARELIMRAEELEPKNMYVRYFAAVTYASLGNTDSALTSIEQAVELGYPPYLLPVDPGLATLAELERFESLLERGDSS